MSDQPAKPERVRHTAPAKYTQYVTARVSDAQLITWDAFRATFDPPSNAEALRWFLDSEAGLEFIGQRVRGEI